MPPGDGLWSMPGVHWLAAPFAALSRRSSMLLTQLFPSHSICMVGHTPLGLTSHPIPLPSLQSGERFSFLGCVPPYDTLNSESVVGVTPGDSGVVIQCQVDEFRIRLWGLLLFWTKHGHYSILTDAVNTPELDASFDEADAMLSSVSSKYLCLVSTHSDNSRLQLVLASNFLHWGITFTCTTGG